MQACAKRGKRHVTELNNQWLWFCNLLAGNAASLPALICRSALHEFFYNQVQSRLNDAL